MCATAADVGYVNALLQASLAHYLEVGTGQRRVVVVVLSA